MVQKIRIYHSDRIEYCYKILKFILVWENMHKPIFYMRAEESTLKPRLKNTHARSHDKVLQNMDMSNTVRISRFLQTVNRTGNTDIAPTAFNFTGQFSFLKL